MANTSMSNTTYPVQHRIINASDIDTTPIIAGVLTVAGDSGQMWFDNLDGTRVIVGKSIEYCSTENDRKGILMPEVDVLYIVRETLKMWIYSNGGWKCLNATATVYFDIINVEIKANATTTVTDSRANTSTDVRIVPDISMADLFDFGDYDIKCEIGQIKITSKYGKSMYATLQCKN